MRVLIVDDDRIVIHAAKKTFRDRYVIDGAQTAKEALRKMSLISYDAVVLDIHLPDLSGIMVCAAIRDRKLAIPILMLTGVATTEQKVRAFEVGADDYLVKPFSLHELEARLQALLRRPQRAAIKILECADLKLDPQAHLVTRSGSQIHLRRKEYELLKYLLQNKNRLVTRSMIEDAVWSFLTENNSNVIDVHIKHLRDAIDKEFPQKLIQTVAGAGYILKDK